MPKKKKDKFQVSFLVTDWVYIDVYAENENRAKEKAQKTMNKPYYGKNIKCMGGRTEYIGITNLTKVEKIGE